MKNTATPENPPTVSEKTIGEKKWTVYIIESSDDTLYTGITTDIEKRWRAHTGGKQGAKFFRGRTPRRIVFKEPGHDRSSASRREYQIKQMKRHEKLLLITGYTESLA